MDEDSHKTRTIHHIGGGDGRHGGRHGGSGTDRQDGTQRGGKQSGGGGDRHDDDGHGGGAGYDGDFSSGNAVYKGDLPVCWATTLSLSYLVSFGIKKMCPTHCQI